MIFDSFDRIRIVNLAYRTDRRAEMAAELRKVGLANDPRVAFFEAFVLKDKGPFRSIGSHGNFRSQLAILEEAANANESVIILEDDVDFTPAVRKYKLPANWSVFYGGYAADDEADLEHSRIIGSHFMGFSAEAAREVSVYLKALLDPHFPPEEIAAAEPGFRPEIRPSIDGAYVWFRRSHPHLKTVFAVPPLGLQRPSRTDVSELRFFDRSPVLRFGASLFRKLKRYLTRERAPDEAGNS